MSVATMLTLALSVVISVMLILLWAVVKFAMHIAPRLPALRRGMEPYTAAVRAPLVRRYPRARALVARAVGTAEPLLARARSYTSVEARRAARWILLATARLRGTARRGVAAVPPALERMRPVIVAASRAIARTAADVTVVTATLLIGFARAARRWCTWAAVMLRPHVIRGLAMIVVVVERAAGRRPGKHSINGRSEEPLGPPEGYVREDRPIVLDARRSAASASPSKSSAPARRVNGSRPGEEKTTRRREERTAG